MLKRDDLWVERQVDSDGDTVRAGHRKVSDAELAELIESMGYVKRPVCGTCKGKPLAEGEYWDGHLPNGDEPDFDGPCPSCGGTGFGRLVGASVELLERLAPEYPMNQDEQGGCVWCGGGSGRSVYAGRNPKDHMPDCPWVEARQAIDQEAS